MSDIERPNLLRQGFFLTSRSVFTSEIFTDNPDTKVNCAWFRGGWYDSLTMAWKDVQEGRFDGDGPQPVCHRECRCRNRWIVY